MMRTKKIYCPCNGWDCPYYKKGECGIEDPINDCDDFGCFWNADDDYICEDEERTAFEQRLFFSKSIDKCSNRWYN